MRLAWSPAIRKERARGQQDGGLGRKLTMLEAVAGAVLFFAVAEQVARSVVTIYTDNSGFYWAYRKGTSRDLFTYTVTRVVQNTDIGELGYLHFTPHLYHPNEHIQLFG